MPTPVPQDPQTPSEPHSGDMSIGPFHIRRVPSHTDSDLSDLDAMWGVYYSDDHKLLARFDDHPQAALDAADRYRRWIGELPPHQHPQPTGTIPTVPEQLDTHDNARTAFEKATNLTGERNDAYLDAYLDRLPDQHVALLALAEELVHARQTFEKATIANDRLQQLERMTADRDNLRGQVRALASRIEQDAGSRQQEFARLTAKIHDLEADGAHTPAELPAHSAFRDLVALLRDHPGGGLIHEPASWTDTLNVVRAHLAHRVLDKIFRTKLIQTLDQWIPAGEPIPDWQLLHLIGQLAAKATAQFEAATTNTTTAFRSEILGKDATKLPLGSIVLANNGHQYVRRDEGDVVVWQEINGTDRVMWAEMTPLKVIRVGPAEAAPHDNQGRTPRERVAAGLPAYDLTDQQSADVAVASGWIEDTPEARAAYLAGEEPAGS